MRSIRSQVWLPVAAAVGLYLTAMAVYVAKHHGDLSSLLCTGANRIGRPPYEAVTASIGPNGYDGQFYYAIARAPWKLQEQGLDAPAPRTLRILYPLVCWLLSGGRARLLFWVMPAVNLAALAGLAALGAWLARHYGRSVWWGLSLPVALNAGLPALHNLTDPLAMLAVFGLLSAWLLGSRAWVVLLWAAVAVFSREQNVAIAGLLLVLALGQRRFDVAAAMLAVVLLWLGWVGWLKAAYGVWPFLPGQGNFAVPLSGMIYRWTHLGGNLAFSRRLAIIFGLSMLHLTLEILLALYLLRRRGDPAVKWCMLAGVLLAVVGGTSIFGDFWSYTRVFVWLPTGLWLTALPGRQSWPLLLLLPAGLWTAVAAANYV
ncbi:MAG: hypothetical protein JO112_19150 [Planctomycetes bacterium]|nr:hypothetical protein [Planctomycetota bacterium]